MDYQSLFEIILVIYRRMNLLSIKTHLFTVSFSIILNIKISILANLSLASPNKVGNQIKKYILKGDTAILIEFRLKMIRKRRISHNKIETNRMI
jgi:hypothetical protein